MRSLVLFLTACAAVAVHVEVSSTLSFDAEAAKNRPVSKVITLIKDMLKQLEKEADEDEEVYDKLVCWCETNEKEKTASIAAAETKIEQLTTKISELTAASARLNAEIKVLQKEISANQDALDKATAIRQKELAEFNGEEKDLLQSISALKAAVTVLSKHNTNFLQLSKDHTSTLAVALKQSLGKHSDLLKGVLTHQDRRIIASFIQEPKDFFDAEPTFKQSYAPQSGQIFGILKQMKETFETNLAASQKDENANAKAYEDLKAAKEAEIQAGQDQVEKKRGELADTDEALAQAKVDLDDTRASLAADEKFLAMLKEKCAMTDAEWEERSKTRQLEIEACSKALAILSSDDAHDLFTRTFNPSLVQTSENSKLRSRAASILRAVGSPRLVELAVRVKLDAFTRVKKAIDDMIAQLLKEKADEIKHKDFCVEAFNENTLQTETKTREKMDLAAKIEELKMFIKKTTDEIEKLNAEIKEMQVQLKRAGEDRELENRDFQTTVSDQRATQKLLQAALDVLKGFYDKKAAAALLQQEPAGPPPPPGFKEYKKNAASGGVMGTIQDIINDAKNMEREAIRAEEEAQAAYEEFVKDTNASIDSKTKEVVQKTEEKAKAEKEHVQAEAEKASVMNELEELANTKAELHASCDFVLKNFDIRQTARDEEVEALRQAKAILSGAKFEEFLQQA